MGCDYSLSVLHVKAKRVAAFVEWVSCGSGRGGGPPSVGVDDSQSLALGRRVRRLLGELCPCAWQTLREALEAVLGSGYTPGVIFAIQTKARTHRKARTKARKHEFMGRART